MRRAEAQYGSLLARGGGAATVRRTCKSLDDLKAAGRAPTQLPRAAPLEVILCPGGSTNYALQIAASTPRSRIGLLIAGNSGRPGGACGHMSRSSLPYCDRKDLRSNHSTQEEDIISNWLLTHENLKGDNPTLLYGATIGGRWGMLYPDWTTVPQITRGRRPQDIKQLYYTIQKKHYRRAAPLDYQDAWHVKNCLVSKKTAQGYAFGESVECSLVFVAGPLANDAPTLNTPSTPGDYASTQFRTFNQIAHDNYDHFIKCVENTFYAGLLAMVLSGDRIAILCHVSGGIYAGPWKAKYGVDSDKKEVYAAITRALARKHNGVALAFFFERVVLCLYSNPPR